jgi:hypothetical protein
MTHRRRTAKARRFTRTQPMLRPTDFTFLGDGQWDMKYALIFGKTLNSYK